MKYSGRMATLDEIRAFLDEGLRISEIPDYPGALNGLQLENGGSVSRVGAAVDASLPVIEKAAAAGVELLIVHHGMFWQGAQLLTGAFFRKIRTAMEGGMAVYSAHLPLDVHSEWGNNAVLARELDVGPTRPFMEWKSLPLGLRAEVELDREALVTKLERVLKGRVHVCPGGPQTIRQLGIVTGGAGSRIAEAAAEGIDTFITGEGPHWSFPLAEELGVNLIYGGHYATETFGVIELARALEDRFGLPWSFVDHPTGL